MNTEQSEGLEQSDEIEEAPIEEESLQEEQTETEEQEPKQSKSQNAKQRLRRKLREQENARRASEERERQLAEKLNALEEKIESVVNPNVRPTRGNFETEEDYEDALFEWRDKKTQVKPEPQQVEPSQDLPQVDPKVLENWQDQMETVGEKYEDFEDSMISIPAEAMTDAMTFAIMESNEGGEIAYFLGNNHAEAGRISRLSVAAQVREIDKLGAKLKPKQTKAPQPINPSKGGDSPSKDPEKMSPEEYRDWRRAQGMGY